jgi:hypothetical protein
VTQKKKTEGRICGKSKWIFKIKRNGIFREILVVCGYRQVPRIGFTESYAPDTNYVSLRISLIGMMVWNLKAKIIDIEIALLQGDLEERIFMEIPSGMKLSDSKCHVFS